MNVLITSAGRRVSLVEFFKKELVKKYGSNSKVITTDLYPELSAASRVADDWIKVGRFANPNYIIDLLNDCIRLNIKFVIPTIDSELLLYAQHRASFLEKGINIMVSDEPFIKICRDKNLTNQFFNSIGIATPKAIDKNNPTFPLFIKPKDGSSSKNLHIIKSAAMLSENLLNDDSLMFMEYLDKDNFDEFTLDLYYDKNSNLKCVVPRLRIEVRQGEISKGITLKNELCDIVFKKMNHIDGARGCITLQLFKQKNGSNIYGIEINPRFGGGYPLSYLAGANFIQWILDEYAEHKTIEQFNSWEENLLLLRSDREMVFKVKNDSTFLCN